MKLNAAVSDSEQSQLQDLGNLAETMWLTGAGETEREVVTVGKNTIYTEVIGPLTGNYFII